MSGRGEPRGGAGGGRGGVVVAGLGGGEIVASQHRDTGTADGTRRAAAGAPGAAGAAHPTPACRSSNAHCDTSQTGLGRCPGVSPSPALVPLRGPSVPLSPAFLPGVPSAAERVARPVALPRRWHPGPPGCLGVLGVTPGTDRAAASPTKAHRGHLWRSVSPSQLAREVPQ